MLSCKCVSSTQPFHCQKIIQFVDYLSCLFFCEEQKKNQQFYCNTAFKLFPFILLFTFIIWALLVWGKSWTCIFVIFKMQRNILSHGVFFLSFGNLSTLKFCIFTTLYCNLCYSDDNIDDLYKSLSKQIEKSFMAMRN